MVEHYSPREEVPSKPKIVTSDRSFSIDRAEFQHLRRVHKALYLASKRVRRLICSGVSNQHSSLHPDIQMILAGLDARHMAFDGRDATFMTTEVVMDKDRRPYIVSIDAHSARHWDSIVGLSRIGHTSLTRSDLLIEAIRKHFSGQELVFIRDSHNRIRYPNFSNALIRQGATVKHRTLSETNEETLNSWQCILELPFMQARKKLCRKLHEKASFLIEPFLHFSSQRMLALLSDEGCYRVIDDYRSIEAPTMDDFAALQRAIPRTYLMGSPSIPMDARVKLSAPLASQRCIGRYDAVPSIQLLRGARGMVAQESINPYCIEIPKGHSKCPLRLILVSYRGEVLAGVGIAQVPANGVPTREVFVDITIR